MEYQLIIERIMPEKEEDRFKDKQYYPGQSYPVTSAPVHALTVRISQEQFEAIRKAVLEKF